MGAESPTQVSETGLRCVFQISLRLIEIRVRHILSGHYRFDTLAGAIMSYADQD